LLRLANICQERGNYTSLLKDMGNFMVYIKELWAKQIANFYEEDKDYIICGDYR